MKLPSLEPESSASANSAIPANVMSRYGGIFTHIPANVMSGFGGICRARFAGTYIPANVVLLNFTRERMTRGGALRLYPLIVSAFASTGDIIHYFLSFVKTYFQK